MSHFEAHVCILDQEILSVDQHAACDAQHLVEPDGIESLGDVHGQDVWLSVGPALRPFLPLLYKGPVLFVDVVVSEHCRAKQLRLFPDLKL